MLVCETTIREAQRRIVACESCHASEVELPFDWILADVLDKRGPVEFMMATSTKSPNEGWFFTVLPLATG